ncbi:MAG: sensor histidine kinase [Cellulosilyticaceae bacterium]
MEMIKNLTITIGSIVVATLVGGAMMFLGLTESNIIMSYIIGMVVIARYTTMWQFSLVGAFVEVALFNYFFARPYYSFQITELHYVMTFTTMIIVASVVITLTSKVKKEVILSQQKEAATQRLYEVSRRLLAADSLEQTKAASAVLVAEFLKKSTLIVEVDSKNRIQAPFIYDEESECVDFFDETLQQQIMEVIKTKAIVYSPSRQMTIYPILRQQNVLGVMGIKDWDIGAATSEESQSLEAIIAQISLALDREYSRLRTHEIKMRMQREKLKNNMLQGISHDLRTPLTGILGSTHLLLENHEKLQTQQVEQLLSGIYDEANWLYHSVENILNMTRIDDGRQIVKKEYEVVQDVIETVLGRIEKVSVLHPITVNYHDQELLVVPMDANLIVKVLYNMLDNAIKYTPVGELITIDVSTEAGRACIAVSDHGPGILEEDLPHLFKRFYRGKNRVQGVTQSRNGIGIGLAICEGIIEAHEGKIIASNNPKGGATFKITLPMDKESDYGE